MKNLILIVTLTLFLFSQTVNFKETKYVDALQLYTYRDGNVTYSNINSSNNKTIVKYKDGKIITKIDNILTVHNDEGELLTTIKLSQKPELALYFKLTKALFSKNFDSLKDNFNIKEPKENEYEFIPKGDIKKAISNIKLSLKKDKTTKSFIINFENMDKVTIETK